MNDADSIATWNALQQFGFVPDSAVLSDDLPGLSFDFGSFKLAASSVMGRCFRPVVLFTGVLATSRTIGDVCFELPRNLTPELTAAFLSYYLDKAADGGIFVPKREAVWVDFGRHHQHRLPWEIERKEQAERAALYAARPHCLVNRPVLRLALNTLQEVSSETDLTEAVIVSFDGRILSFVCNGVEASMVATGAPWSGRYKISVAAIRGNLPKRLMSSSVQVGIWNSTLEIDRARYREVQELNIEQYQPK